MSIWIRKIVHQGTSYSFMIALYLEGPMFRRSYVQKVLCSENICSETLLFRRSYVWKVLYSEGPVFRRSLFRRAYVGTHSHLSFSGIKTFFISVHFTFLFHFLHNFIIHFFLGYTLLTSENPTVSKLQISKFPSLKIRTNSSSDVQKLRRHAYALCAASFL